MSLECVCEVLVFLVSKNTL